MVFHVGVIWRLHETGVLATARSAFRAYPAARSLPARWRLEWNERTSTEPAARATSNVSLSRRCASWPARPSMPSLIIFGVLLPGTISDRIAAAYDKYLFGGATLQDLPGRTALRHQRHQRAIGCAVALHEALHGGLPRRHRRAAEGFASGGGNGVLGVSAGAVAVRAMRARSGILQAEVRAPICRKSPSPAKSFSPTAACTTISGLRPIWKRYDTILVSDAGGHMRRRSRAENRLGAAFLPRLQLGRQSGARFAQASGDRLLRCRSWRRQPPQGRLLGHPNRYRRLPAWRCAVAALTHTRCNWPETPTRLKRMENDCRTD